MAVLKSDLQLENYCIVEVKLNFNPSPLVIGPELTK